MPAGTWIAYSVGSPSNFMVCTLAATLTAGTALSVTSQVAIGSGTYTDWAFAPLNNTRRAVNIQTGDYTVLISDLRATILLNKATAATLTLPTVSSLGLRYELILLSIGVGAWSITPNAADAIDDKAVGVAIVLRKNEGIHLESTAANSWRITATRGYGARPRIHAAIRAL